MPNARINNTRANSGIRNWFPNVRSTHTTSSTAGGTVIAIGTPIGLLLALTYAVQQMNGSTTSSSDFKPNARIR